LSAAWLWEPTPLKTGHFGKIHCCWKASPDDSDCHGFVVKVFALDDPLAELEASVLTHLRGTKGHVEVVEIFRAADKIYLILECDCCS
jgi:hypothetical protein